MNTKRIGSLILILTIVAMPIVDVFADEAAETEQYLASAGFSTTQGENNWYYKSRNCNTNAESELSTTASSDDTTVWRQGGGNDRGYISKDTMLPGINVNTVYDTLRVFKAPKSGTLVIGANGDIGAKDLSIDKPFGVQICIKKNGQKIYPANSDWTELNERSLRISFESILAAVDKGDEISFEAHRTLTGLTSTEMRQNIIRWDPVITYLNMESVRVGGYSDGLQKELEGFCISDEGEFYLSERGSGKVMFGGNTLENCGISAKASETDTEGEILLYANYSGEGGYSVRFSQEGTALLKNGEQVAAAENTLSDGANILIETASVGSAVFVSVKLDGTAVITYLDEDGCAPGGLGIGAENAVVRLGDISFYASTAQHDDLGIVKEAVEVCEQLKENVSIENLSAASAAVMSAENSCAAYVLDAVIQKTLSDSGYRYIDAEAETEGRILRVKGVAYDLRNSEIILVVSDSRGSIAELRADADSNGVIGGEVTLPTSVGSGELIIESKENKLKTTVVYRAPSAECSMRSFRLDGVSGEINANDILVSLTKRTELKNMVALFTASDYAEVYVNGVKQESGVTVNDFSNQVIYTVKAENGDEKNYSVKVSYKAESNSHGGLGSGSGSSSGGGAGVKRAVAVDKSIFAAVSDEYTEYADRSDSNDGAYADVSVERWSYEYIKGLTDKNIVCGNNDGRFEPERSITRAEFIKMIVLALGLEEADNGVRFDDVSDEDWYSSYVRTACAHGIAEGYDGYFGANDYITREDMCVIVHRCSGGLPQANDGIDFGDAEEISDYARDSVAALCSAGIITGEDGSFNPKHTATREQAAKLVFGICK